MSIKDLDYILKKDPIIPTFSATELVKEPKKVQKEYLLHAKTHLSLGDTAAYVERVIKWVSGENKGAFIGAVLGDYGEGKTSFLVHLWEQCTSKKVLAVPPFQWSKFEDILSAIAGWVTFILESERPELVAAVKREYEGFKENTIEKLAREMASDGQTDYDNAYNTIKLGLEKGKIHLTGISATSVLDFIEKLSAIVISAGYKGMLVLLDEPEVAAKHLGDIVVQGFIFELADVLNQRQGNYGVFLSMPQNFYAICEAKFAALTARLQARQCFPRLGDIFGLSFASDLWKRYVEKFDLGEEGNKVIDDWGLRAIGQIGSSDNRHLGYGPRTVVSAFNRMVAKYLDKKVTYTAKELLKDLLSQEIMAKPDYRTHLNSVLNSQDVTDENRTAVEFLSVFPSGLKIEDLNKLGYESLLRPLSTGNGLVQISAHTMVLRRLKHSGGETRGDILEEVIQEYDAQFAPGLAARKRGIKAFVDYLLPEIFEKRKGSALNGWSDEETIKDVGNGQLFFGVKNGSFDETSKTFPLRAALIAVGSPEANFTEVKVPQIDLGTGPVTYDLLYKFTLNTEISADENVRNSVNIKIRNNKLRVIEFDMALDLINSKISQDYLGNMVGAERLSPLWLLGLLGYISSVTLPMEYQNLWDVIKQEILRELKKYFFGVEFSDLLKDNLSTNYQINLTEVGTALLDKATAAMLFQKYPEYSTLMKQAQWVSRVNDYIAALENVNIPLECKRGKTAWTAPSQQVATALHSSPMNISGGAFESLGNLIKIKVISKDQPWEVKFLIHPFEQEIANHIISDENPDRIKVDNIDCPCLSIRVQLIDRLKEYGYTVEELSRIINIGIARKTFERKNRGGEEVLFCRPLDLEGLKDNLKSKVASLETEVKQMQKISWYTLNLDFDKAYRDIENLQNDTDYDTENRFIDERKNDHVAKVKIVYAKIIEEIDSNITNPLIYSKKGLNEDRRILSLRIVEAKSSWIGAFNEYIVPNFQQTVNKSKTTYDDIQRRSEQLKARISTIETISRNEVITRLVECYDEYLSLKEERERETEEVTHLFNELKYFEEWLKLKNESDIAYSNILELKNTEAHREVAESLLTEFSSASGIIEDHLRLANIVGLKDYQRFRQSLLDIDKKREDYLSHLRVEFNGQKERINKLFSSMNLEPMKNIFDQSNTKQSYDSLYADALHNIRKGCFEFIRNELYVRQMDILYASNILNTIESNKAEELLTQKSILQEKLSVSENQVSKEWLIDELGRENPEIIELVKEAYKLSDEYYKIIMNATRPKELSNDKLKELNKEIQQKEEIDLKDLILYVSKRVEKPQQAMDETLTSLSELFKSNNVEVKVKYRRR